MNPPTLPYGFTSMFSAFFDEAGIAADDIYSTLTIFTYVLAFAGLLMMVYRMQMTGEMTGMWEQLGWTVVVAIALHWLPFWVRDAQNVLGFAMLDSMDIDIGQIATDHVLEVGTYIGVELTAILADILVQATVLTTLSALTFGLTVGLAIGAILLLVLALLLLLWLAIITVWVWLAVLLAYVVQTLSLQFGVAAAPLFLGMFLFEQTKQTALRYFTGLVGMLFWPLGWGIGFKVVELLKAQWHDVMIACSPLVALDVVFYGVVDATVYLIFSYAYWTMIKKTPPLIMQAITSGAQIGAGIVAAGISSATSTVGNAISAAGSVMSSAMSMIGSAASSAGTAAMAVGTGGAGAAVGGASKAASIGGSGGGGIGGASKWISAKPKAAPGPPQPGGHRGGFNRFDKDGPVMGDQRDDHMPGLKGLFDDIFEEEAANEKKAALGDLGGDAEGADTGWKRAKPGKKPKTPALDDAGPALLDEPAAPANEWKRAQPGKKPGGDADEAGAVKAPGDIGDAALVDQPGDGDVVKAPGDSGFGGSIAPQPPKGPRGRSVSSPAALGGSSAPGVPPGMPAPANVGDTAAPEIPPAGVPAPPPAEAVEPQHPQAGWQQAAPGVAPEARRAPQILTGAGHTPNQPVQRKRSGASAPAYLGGARAQPAGNVVPPAQPAAPPAPPVPVHDADASFRGTQVADAPEHRTEDSPYLKMLETIAENQGKVQMLGAAAEAGATAATGVSKAAASTLEEAGDISDWAANPYPDR